MEFTEMVQVFGEYQNEIKVNLNPYFDGYGLLAQANGDGGDSASRTGALYSLLPNPTLLHVSLMQLQGPEAGTYVRHPGGASDGKRYSPWYANPKNFTRDQSINLQSAMVINDAYPELKALVKARAKRLFFHFNDESYDDSEPISRTIPDPPQLREFGQFIRGLRMWYLRPLLYILDLDLIVAALSVSKSDVTFEAGDGAQKLICVLISAQKRYPTFLSKLANIIVKRSNAASKIKLNFSEENGQNGIKPMGDLFVKALGKS